MEYSGIPGSTPDEGVAILFQMAMNGKWDDVVVKLTENPFFLGAGVTRTNDTLLHLAVSEGQEKTVLKMINIITALPNPKKSVQPRNVQGNTALHLAAMVGNVAMCKCIASVDSSLIGERNDKGETPLFTAVLFGKTQAFQLLYYMCQSDIERHSCSRITRTGDTILHCAISEGYFDLALRVIKLYGKELANAVNLEGITPLHLLAEKPWAFQSGSLLLHGFCKTIIYRLLAMIKHKVREPRDPERQPEDPELSARNGGWKHRFSLSMYGLFYKIFKLATRTIMVVLITLGRKLPETPILIAARNGISEIVKELLEQFPIAIHDMNEENKNAMLLAVQNRQPRVFQILLEKNILVRDRVLRVVDKSGNNAAHLAAMRGEYRPWQIAGEALQMQYEIKWFEFVRGSKIPSNFFTHRNKAGQTPEELFIKNHEDLVKRGGEWLVKTSESYSLVAALIATVAFATSTAVPGGVKNDIGIPTLENRTPFHFFAISSLIALFFSVTALVTFLSILTSRYKARDFAKDLPMKLLIGLTSLFFSIAAMLISFCSGHLFVVDDKLKNVAYTVYAATCVPVTLFAVMQFPLYFDLIDSTFRNTPRSSYKASVF